jgi:hypothetical protein
MKYERQDSNAKAKNGKEPQILHPTNIAGKKMTRREMLFKAMKGAK